MVVLLPDTFFKVVFSLALSSYEKEGLWKKNYLSQSSTTTRAKRAVCFRKTICGSCSGMFARRRPAEFQPWANSATLTPKFLQDYEEEIYNLRPEAYRLIFHVYGLLFDDFKVKKLDLHPKPRGALLSKLCYSVGGAIYCNSVQENRAADISSCSGNLLTSRQSSAIQIPAHFHRRESSSEIDQRDIQHAQKSL